MRLLPFLPCLLLSLFLAACGGGDGGGGNAPATARAQGLTGVDVEDGNGQLVMRHRFAAVSSNEDVVTTTQDAGSDGVWGTADDWRTALTHCRYQAGSASAELADVLSFSPESFFTIDPAACTWRRALNGSVAVEIEGDNGSGAQVIRDALSAAGGQESFEALGLMDYLQAGDFLGLLNVLLGEIPVMKFGLRADAAGTVLCYDSNCAASTSVSPAAAACREQCDAFGETLIDAPVADGITPVSDSCTGTVSLYDGLRFAPVYLRGHLRRVVASQALDQPFCYPYGYTLYERDAGGKLLSSDDYLDAGSDGIWFTPDDTRYERMVLQSEGSTVRRSYYHGAGEDGAWGTADDVTDRVLVLVPDSRGRLQKARRCLAAGEDGQWNTADDVCETLTFRYAD